MKNAALISKKAALNAVLALFLLPGIAPAQVNSSGVEGMQQAKELLDSFAMPVIVNDDRAHGDMGTIDLGDGVRIPLGEMVPIGAQSSRAEMEALGSLNQTQLQNHAQDEIKRISAKNDHEGEALRSAVMSQPTRSLQSYGVSIAELNATITTAVAVESTFQDMGRCSDDAQHGVGDSILTKKGQTYTCSIGTQGSVCSRARIVDVEVPEDPDEELSVTDKLVFDGKCEEAIGGNNRCTTRWVCTDTEPRTINGLLIDEESAEELGLAPLFPGAPVLCWSAAAELSCDVCIEDDFGNQSNCKVAEISSPEGNSCGALESAPSCRTEGTTCLVTDDDTGACIVMSKRYTCEDEVEIPTVSTADSRTCNAPIQCVGDECAGGVTFKEEQGMAIEIAMAQLAVADTMTTDASANSNAGPMAGSSPGEVQMFRGNPLSCQKGYGGLVDCCKATDSNAKELFWTIHAKLNRMAQANRLAAEQGISGYRALQQPGVGIEALSNPFTSARDNVTGGNDNAQLVPMGAVWDEFMARARAEIKPALSPKWACKSEEFDLAVQREVGLCSYAGTYCSQRVLGACLKRKEAYCCYKSPMSKMLKESTEPAGTPPSYPACDGVPIEELGRVDWSAMDFSQLVGNMSEGGVFDKVNDRSNLAEQLTGSGMAAVGEGRSDVITRTTDRMNDIDFDQARSSIAADVAARDERDVADSGRGSFVAFSTAYTAGQSGRPLVIGVTRTGRDGSTSATVSLGRSTVDLGGFQNATVSWGNGESGEQYVRLDPPAGSHGTAVLQLQAGQGATSATMTVEVY